MSKTIQIPLSAWQQSAETIAGDVRKLLQDVRSFLDQNDLQELYGAESDLNDALECLLDFVDNCQELEEPKN